MSSNKNCFSRNWISLLRNGQLRRSSQALVDSRETRLLSVSILSPRMQAKGQTRKAVKTALDEVRDSCYRQSIGKMFRNNRDISERNSRGKRGQKRSSGQSRHFRKLVDTFPIRNTPPLQSEQVRERKTPEDSRGEISR